MWQAYGFLICGVNRRGRGDQHSHLETRFVLVRVPSDSRDCCPKGWRLGEIFKKRWNPEGQERRSVEEMTRAGGSEREREGARGSGAEEGVGTVTMMDRSTEILCPFAFWSAAMNSRDNHGRYRRRDTGICPSSTYKLNLEIWGNWGEKGPNRKPRRNRQKATLKFVASRRLIRVSNLPILRLRFVSLFGFQCFDSSSIFHIFLKIYFRIYLIVRLF